MVLQDEHGARHTEKKEAMVIAHYTIAPHQADVEAIADTLAKRPVDSSYVAPKQPRPEPVGKQLRATLAGKDVAFNRLVGAVRERDGPHIQHRVVLTDGGAGASTTRGGPPAEFTLILDIVHVKVYVRDASIALLGADHPALWDYIARRLHEILTGRLDRALACFEDGTHLTRTLTPAEEKVLAGAIGYLTNNKDYMHYDEYLAKGWPIATGVAEGGCGYLVKNRMEGPA
jgi:hypothetical protein